MNGSQTKGWDATHLWPEDEFMNVQFPLRFLGIILRVFRLQVSEWICMVFYPVFLLSPLQCTVTEL
jgi:hypothetical protein